LPLKKHVSSILSKLGVRDRTRAVLKALELGFIYGLHSQSLPQNLWAFTAGQSSNIVSACIWVPACKAPQPLP
jgi:hypothetical protein